MDLKQDRLIPTLYGIVSAVHLGLNISHIHPWDTVTKCLLAPTLVLWTLRSPQSLRQFALALTCCFVGDLSLDLSAAPGDLWFLAGMVAFAIGHVNFIAIFKPHVASSRLFAAAPPVTALAIALLYRTWDGLEEDLRIPVCVYAGLLGTTTVTALATGNGTASAGAALFMISDAMILLNVAKDPYTPQPAGVWIMATYAAAIFLLTAGVLNGQYQRTNPLKSKPRSGGRGKR
jgi:uncharacterized membrane protein YhhN